MKPYKARTLKGAEAKVNQLLKSLRELEEKNTELACGRYLMAKLASREPQFYNPLVVMSVERMRDTILHTPFHDREALAKYQGAVWDKFMGGG